MCSGCDVSHVNPQTQYAIPQHLGNNGSMDKPSKPMVRKSVTLPEGLWEVLQAYAASQSRSASAQVAHWIKMIEAQEEGDRS